MIFQSRREFFNAPKEFRDDPEYMLGGIEKFSYSIMMGASERLKNDSDFMLKSIKLSDGATYSYASRALKSDREFVHGALELSTEVYSEISKKWREEFVSYGLSNPCKYYRYLPKEYQNNPDIVYQCLHIVYEFLDETYRDDETLFQMVFTHNVKNYIYASERIRNKRKYVMTALSRHGRLLEHVPERYKDNRRCVLKAVRNDPELAFRFASERLRDDKYIALLAMKWYGRFNFEHLSMRLQNDPKLIAMKWNCRIIDWGCW